MIRCNKQNIIDYIGTKNRPTKIGSHIFNSLQISNLRNKKIDFIEEELWFRPDLEVGYISRKFLIHTNPIGRGGFGVIFLAYDILNDKEVIIKVQHLNISLVQKEVFIAKKLHNTCPTKSLKSNIYYRKNPNISKNIYNEMMIISSPVGKNLYEFVNASLPQPKSIRFLPLPPKPIPIKVKHGIICQLFHILLCLYKSDIIHCDLKLDNFIILQDGEIIVIDYGTSIINDFSSKYTEPPLEGWTWNYLAPEKCKTHKSDIYSLGIIIGEIIAEEDPRDTSFSKYVGSTANNTANFKQFFYKLTDKDPDKRPSIEEILTGKETLNWRKWYITNFM